MDFEILPPTEEKKRSLFVKVAPHVSGGAVDFLKKYATFEGGVFVSRFKDNTKILELLSAEEVYFNGKRLSFDLYGGVESVDEVDLRGYGDQPWFIKGIALRVVRGDFEWEEPKVDPLPVLQLNDHHGAFASLYMAYGDKREYYDPYFPPLDKVARSWERDLLETDFYRKRVGESDYFCPTDKVHQTLLFLLELGWSVFNEKQIVAPTDSSCCVEKGESIVVSPKITYGDQEASAVQIYDAISRNDRFVELGPGKVGLLPPRESNNALYHAVEEGSCLNNRLEVPLEKIGFFYETTQEVEVQPSAAFVGELRSYQQRGVNWLQFLYENHFHGLLADDMGLGKTVQVLAFLSTRQSGHLVVVPTSLIFNWKQEILRFLPSAKISIFHGTDRELDLSAHITLTSYATLRQDAELLASVAWDCVILDEAQAIKNPQSQTAKAACELKARLRLSITGTPVENHLNELWSHFAFLMPGFLKKEQLLDLNTLRRLVSPFILRREKSEVAKDLPDRIEQTVYITMKEEQEKLYQDYLSNTAKSTMEILEKILRLRQICCHPLLLQEEVESAKLDCLLRDLETLVEEGKKVIIYSQFTSMLNLIARKLKWDHVKLTGETKNREEVVSRFQNETVPIFLISLKAGGSGLNLTAADYVLLFDPWWNEAVEDQAISRAHRIGRKDCVIAKRYVTLNTIEERMMLLKEKKRGLATEIFSEEMSTSDLEYLLDFID